MNTLYFYYAFRNTLLVLLVSVLTFACTANPAFDAASRFASKKVTISWDANNELNVNSSGGGYIVYYSITQNFDVDSAESIEVPFEDHKTSVELEVETNTSYYVRIAAYQNINGTEYISTPSEEQRIFVSTTGGLK